MKLEETIQKMYDFYPSLFTERWQCLNHLFCVIGNGYRWVNGELVGDSYKEEKGYTLQLGPSGKATLNIERAKAYLAEYYQETADLSAQFHKRKYEFLLFEKLEEKTPEEIKEIFQHHNVKTKEELADKALIPFDKEKYIEEKIEEHFEPKEISFYPLCHFSSVFDYPEDIKPDWFEGVKEIAALLAQHGHKIPEEFQEKFQTLL